MPSLTELSAEELIARGVAPIKKQYILPFISRKAEPAAAATGGEAAAGEAGAAAGPSAPPAAAAAAAAAVSGPLKPKSKRQQRKDRQQVSRNDICTNFLFGRCSYGDSCRFSHDTAAYLAAKPPDLPGNCIFNGTPEGCPYGITCCWAGSHPAPAAPAAAAGASNKQAPADGEQEAAAAPAAAAGAAAAAGGGVDGASAADSPLQPVQQLPPVGVLQRPVNVLPKQLQQDLWKGRVDFSRADGVLRRLSLTNNAAQKQQHQQRKQQQQQHKRQAAPAGGEAAAAAKKPRLDAAAAAAPAAAAGGGAAAAGDADLDMLYADDMPAATPAATPAAAAAPAAAPAAAAVGDDALDELYEAEAAAGKAAAAPAAAAAQAEGVDAPAAAGSDAALLSNIKQQQEQQQQGQQEQQQQEEGRVGSCALDITREPRRCPPKLDLAGRTYLAPLTTVGNLPFRRLCVGLGCEVTCGEMALATNLLQGQASEWALLKRHPCEKRFGVQVCGGYPDAMARLAQLVDESVECDFIDINCGCPIDIICNRGAGSALLKKPRRLGDVVRATTAATDKPVIVKIRKGYDDGADVAHTLIPELPGWGAAGVTLHGRTRQQRYSRSADWDYIGRCAGIAAGLGLPLVGNGDVFSPGEWAERLSRPGVATAMIGRGALIKPWIFTEIAEQRLWDISASERLDLLKLFVSHGLEAWGSDARGVETTRRFLLEWLSFTHRYIPVGLLEVVPQVMQWRPPAYSCRSQLEGLLASESAADWVALSEMLLGPAPPSFSFTPKHKSNAFALSAEQLAQMAQAAASSRSLAAGDVGEEEGEGQENG